jgi:hypothetical protein
MKLERRPNAFIFQLICVFVFYSQALHAQQLIEKQDIDSISVSDEFPFTTATLQDKQGFIWISSVDGLARYDGYSFLKITGPKYFPNDTILTIAEGNDGFLWLGHSSGYITRLDPRAMSTRAVQIAKGKRRDVSRVYCDPKGNIWAALRGAGLFLYNGKDGFDFISALPNSLGVLITEVRNNNESIYNFQSRTGLSVNYFENSLSIEFVALDYDNSLPDSYLYKMEGLADEWTSTSNHMVNYAALPSGNYTFRVKLEGQPDNSEDTVHIFVDRPFWKERWFIGIVVLMLGISIYALYRLRLKIIREEERVKSELKQQLSDMEMKALRAQMSPHFLFNSLNSINRYIVKSDPETASLYLTKFSKLMRLILENSHHKVITLEQELNALKLYMELEALRFNNKFKYTLSVNESISPMTVGVPPMIIQPFIENAIWHGLLHKNSPGLLEIKIDAFESGIQCIILDNGVGRKKAAELKSKSISRDKSYGMKITTDRLKMSNDSSVSAVEIVDLADESGNALGTKVILKIVVVELEPEF